MLNQQIGPYKIISKLGEGGMANVYLAEKGTLGKKVALKVLKDEFLLNQHIRNRFLSEARKMSGLNHANIVDVHDLIDETNFVAIELDYVEGKTLKQHLHEKGALPDVEIEALFKQMLAALAYIHEKGFVHRDVKPSNFMLTDNGIIKLTDFGIAKNVDDSNMDYTGTGTGMQMGTPKYMSPEQVRSTKDVDHRTDIYSLGVVLWEMVTGKVPYDLQTSSTFDVFTKIVNEPLEKTNTRWDEVIQKATKKDRTERIKRTLNIPFQTKDNDGNKNRANSYLYRVLVLSGILLITIIYLINRDSTVHLQSEQSFLTLMEEGYTENTVLWRDIGRVDFKINESGRVAVMQEDFTGTDFEVIRRDMNNIGKTSGSTNPHFSFDITSTEYFIKEFEAINENRRKKGLDSFSYRTDVKNYIFAHFISFIIPVLLTMILWWGGVWISLKRK